MKRSPIIFIVDDDPDVRKGLRHLLCASGYDAEAFDSAEEFLSHHDFSRPGCVICDVAMPGLDGLALQRRLVDSGSARPMIFLTGRGTIPGSVRAMKEGAVDYLTKPVEEADLLRVVRMALDRDRTTRAVRGQLDELTDREQDVLRRVAEGHLNKQIASDLGVAERTVKFHRRNLMRKLGFTSAAKLTRFGIQAALLDRRRSVATKSPPKP